jgi:hypothetical protein
MYNYQQAIWVTLIQLNQRRYEYIITVKCSNMWIDELCDNLRVNYFIQFLTIKIIFSIAIWIISIEYWYMRLLSFWESSSENKKENQVRISIELHLCLEKKMVDSIKDSFVWSMTNIETIYFYFINLFNIWKISELCSCVSKENLQYLMKTKLFSTRWICSINIVLILLK